MSQLMPDRTLSHLGGADIIGATNDVSSDPASRTTAIDSAPASLSA
ncbi:hypothetical protein ACFOEP_12825 [Microbacterium amylolyticum]